MGERTGLSLAAVATDAEPPDLVTRETLCGTKQACLWEVHTSPRSCLDLRASAGSSWCVESV